MLRTLAHDLRLTAPACVTNPRRFDYPRAASDAEHARVAAAQAECRRCPELLACARWLDALPQAKKPIGVFAGKVIAFQRTDRP